MTFLVNERNETNWKGVKSNKMLSLRTERMFPCHLLLRGAGLCVYRISWESRGSRNPALLALASHPWDL